MFGDGALVELRVLTSSERDSRGIASRTGVGLDRGGLASTADVRLCVGSTYIINFTDVVPVHPFSKSCCRASIC
jgi:hypothetical protein